MAKKSPQTRAKKNQLPSIVEAMGAATGNDAIVQNVAAPATRSHAAAEELIAQLNSELAKTRKELDEKLRESLQEEIEARIRELNHANNDLENLLRSTQIATVFIDANGLIQRFTPALNTIYSLNAADLGRPLEEIPHRITAMPPLPGFDELSPRGAPIEDEVQAQNGSWFLRRVLPYIRGEHVDGMIIAFIDITEQKRVAMRLATEYRVTQILADADSFEEVVPVILDAMRGTSHSEFVSLWLLDQHTGELACAWCSYNSDDPSLEQFAIETRRRRFSDGTGFPGRVWNAQEALWIEDIAADPSFGRRALAVSAGLTSGGAIPITVGTQFDGVIEIFTRGRAGRDPSLTEMLRGIGHEIGQFIRRKKLADKIRDQEARKSAILEAALDCIVTIDLEGRIVDFNQAAERTFGYLYADVTGKLLSETIIPEEFRASHTAGLQKLLNTGQSRIIGKRLELTAVRADGSRFPVELAVSASENRDGSKFFVGYIRDITEQKQTLQAICERDERITALLNSTAEGIYGIDLEGICTFANAACAKLLGYSSPEQLIGQQMHERIHHTQADGTPYSNGDCRIYRAFRAGEPVHVDEEVFWREDGTKFDVEYWSYPQLHDGRVFGCVVTFLDVSQRRKQDRELADKEAHLRRVIDNMLGFVGVLSLEGELLEVNEGALVAGGLERSDVIGRKFWDCYWWSHDSAVNSRLRDALQKARTGEIVRFDVCVRMKGDSRMMIDFMLAPVRDESGKITFLIPSGVDISDRKRAEDSVTDREGQLQSLVEASSQIIWMTNAAGNVMEDSPTWRAFTGQSRDEWLGNGWINAIHPDDREGIAKAWQHSLAGGEALSFEYRLQHVSGQWRWTHVRSIAQRNEDGSIRRWIGMNTDITEHKCRELTLAFHAELQGQLGDLTHASDIIETVAARLTDYLQLSRCIMASMDVSLDTAEVFYDHCGDGLPSLRGAYRIDEFLTSFERQQLMAGNVVVFSDTSRDTQSAAAIANYSSLGIGSLVCAPCNQNDRQTFLLAVSKQQPYQWRQDEIDLLRDLVAQLYVRIERARAEAALLESEQTLRDNEDRLTMALKAGGMAAWEWNTKESVWTRELYELLGASQDTAASPELFFKAVHPDDLPKLKSGWQASVDGENAFRQEFRIIRPDGSVRWLVSNGEVHRDRSGKVIRIFGLTWDSTREHEIAESLRASERKSRAANLAKTAFIANMSHEIRTPMTAVLGYADLLAAQETNQEKSEYLRIIKRNGNFLLDIINDILDLSKIEAGKMEISRERFSPHAVLADVESMMSVRAREKGLQFKVEFHGPIPELIESDAKRLKQILVNLTGNAIKFTEAGSVRVVTQYLPGSHSRLQLQVIDTGIGMTDLQQSRLFQPFSQGDASVTRAFGGTGLGLAISQRLAEILGGGITASSVLGSGSEFTVTIDTGNITDVVLIEPVPVDAAEPSSLQQPEIRLQCRVLVVDDRRDVRFLTNQLLVRAGATVELAVDGQVALELVEQMVEGTIPAVDLILLDMQMPRLDGYQTTIELRNMGFDRPIIALTADAMHGDMSRCIECGCDSYLSKPIDSEALISIVHRFTQGKPS